MLKEVSGLQLCHFALLVIYGKATCQVVAAEENQ